MQKKFLFTISLILILVSIFTINSYASSEFSFSFKDKKIYYNDEKLDFPDISSSQVKIEPKYFTLYKNGDNYWFFISEYPFYLSDYKTQWYTNQQGQFNCDEGQVVEFVLNKGSTSWRYNRTSTCPYVSTGNNWHSRYALYCNYDLKYKDEIVVYAYGTTPLLKTMRSIKTMNTVTSEIVSILPITLTVLVVFIGVRKAVAFTRNKLRNA